MKSSPRRAKETATESPSPNQSNSDNRPVRSTRTRQSAVPQPPAEQESPQRQRSSPRKQRKEQSEVAPPEEEQQEMEVDGDFTAEANENDDNFEGDEYLDKYGNCLKEDYKLQLKTFTLKKRSPGRRFMLVLDLARAMNHQDSFRFMKTYPQLPRINIDQSEREELIEQGVVHPIMKFRNVPIVSVIGAYRMFGLDVLKAAPLPALQLKKKETAPSSQPQEQPSIFSGGGGGDVLLMDDDELESFRQARQQALSAEEGVHLRSLKPPARVERENGDWMYQSALAACKYNVSLRVERADRLWGEEEFLEQPAGSKATANSAQKLKQQKQLSRRAVAAMKRKSFKEESSDDEFYEESEEESDEEEASDDDLDKESSASNVRRHRIRRKTGFYDVHTNQVQVPAYTQISNVKTSTRPLDLDDLLVTTKGGSEPQVEIINPESQQLKQHYPASSSLVYWLGPRYLPSRDPKLYPVALIHGQYQGIQSAYKNRFAPPQSPEQHQRALAVGDAGEVQPVN